MFTFRVKSVFIFFLLSNCGRTGSAPYVDTNPKPIPNVALQDQNSDCPNGTLLSYQNFGEAFLLAHCTNCHSSEVSVEKRLGAPEDVNLDKSEYVAIWRVKMSAIAAGKKSTMPPGHQLPTAQRNRLKEWLACGATVSDDQLE